jgi:hypothetical protein
MEIYFELFPKGIKPKAAFFLLAARKSIRLVRVKIDLYFPSFSSSTIAATAQRQLL